MAVNVPEPLRLIGPDTVQVREGGARGQVFGGFLAFASGLFVLLMVVGVIPRGTGRELFPWEVLFALVVGLMFVAAGVWGIAGRRWTTLYAGADRVVTQSGLFVPLRSLELPLHQYAAVALRYAPGDSRRYPVHYPVVLQAASGGVDLPLTSSTEYTQALEQAQFLAQFLRLPLIDVTKGWPAASGQAAVREAPPYLPAEAADKARIREVVQPNVLWSRVTEVDGGVRIAFPRPKFPLNALYVPLGFFLIVAVVVPVQLRSFREQGTALWLQLVCGVFLALFVGIPLYAMLSAWMLSKRGGMVVLATRAGITIEQHEAWSTKTTVIPSADIIDIDYGTGSASVASSARQAYEERLGQVGPGPLPAGARAPEWVSQLMRSARAGVIGVKTQQGIFTFGKGLPDDEVAYLWALVERALGRA